MSTATVDIKNSTIISTRMIDASHEVVFNAFANPDNLKHWWGPNGFTNTIEQFDFKPGGAWKFVMHSEAGTDYHNRCEFTEIVENEKVVFIHYLPVHHFTMTLGFEAMGNQTKFSFTMVFQDPEEVEKTNQFIVQANEQNFDRLENFIKKNLK